MKVYFIGAGPGAPDLITVRGARILSATPIVMYAGSLVPAGILSYCRPEAELIDTAALDLDAQEQHYRRALELGFDVARVHSGDPSIYGATAEQMRRLSVLGIEFEVVPGVSSFTAAAAVLNAELTKPGVSQTVILTRVSGRASPVPELEALESLAAHRATICIFLSGPHLECIVKDLQCHYPGNTPVALVRRVTWDEEKAHLSTLERVLSEVDLKDWSLTTLMIVGDVLSESAGAESRLYAAAYRHRFRAVATGAGIYEL